MNRTDSALLGEEFFDRSTLDVARDLLGREIVRYVTIGGRKACLRARIVETEAYLAKDDPASHSFRGPTHRAQVMFEDPATIYVYFIYGNYFMLNFVTQKKGIGEAVLIRAVEPIEGLVAMQNLRFKSRKSRNKTTELTNGPAKLALALGIDATLNGKKLGLPHLAVSTGELVADSKVRVGPRIGVSRGKNLPYRFFLKNNAYVSRR